MKTGTFPEYLGDVSTESLLQNLTNMNPAFSSIDAFRKEFPRGFEVSAQVELPVPETHEEQALLVQSFHLRLAKARTNEEKCEAMNRPDRKLIGLALTPKA